MQTRIEPVSVSRSPHFAAGRITRFLFALLGALVCAPDGTGHNTPVKPPPIPLPVSGSVRVDPVPNTEDPITGAPLDGGVRYRWTVNLAGNGSTRFTDSTAAWGWDEDGNPATEEGRTEAARWIALNLKSPSTLTVRIARRSDVIDPLALFPGDLAGANLKPAFTIFAGWDGDGGDQATFPNRGTVPWAEDLTYIDHVETDGAVAEGNFTLPAGLYTIALGGNSTSIIPEPRQGYEASLTSVSLEKAPKYRLTSGGKPGSKPVLRLSGRIGTPGEITTLKVYFHGKTQTVTVRNGAWSATLKGLDPGKTLIWLTPISKYGTVFPHQRLVVKRR